MLYICKSILLNAAAKKTDEPANLLLAEDKLQHRGDSPPGIEIIKAGK